MKVAPNIPLCEHSHIPFQMGNVNGIAKMTTYIIFEICIALVFTASFLAAAFSVTQNVHTIVKKWHEMNRISNLHGNFILSERKIGLEAKNSSHGMRINRSNEEQLSSITPASGFGIAA